MKPPVRPLQRLLFCCSLLFACGALPEAAAGQSTYTGKKISIDLQDTNIHNFFRIISEISGYNIVTSADVHGEITLRLTDVPWDQCLELVLRTNGLYQVREGNVIMIVPVQQVKQLYFD